MAIPTTDETQETGARPESTPATIKKVFVVLNPVAGLTDAALSKETIGKFCEEHSWECELHETHKGEDLRQLVRDVIKSGVDIVIAAGGDGTVSEVVCGMVDSQVPMGILPSGTGNNLARDLGIPIDLPAALNLLAGEYDIRTMDVMQVCKTKFYLLNVSVGISSMTMHKTRRSEKRRFGMFAYIYRAIGSIIHSDVHHFYLKVDRKPIHLTASELMIANSKLMGMQPQIPGVEVNANDGRLDIFIVRAQSIRDYLSVALSFLFKRKSKEEPNLNYIQAHKTIEIESKTPLPVQADGEVLGNTPVDVKLLPSALRVIAPKSAA